MHLYSRTGGWWGHPGVLMAVIQMPNHVMTSTSEWLHTPKTDSDSQHWWTHAINTCIYPLWLKEQILSVRGYSGITKDVRYDLCHRYISVPPSAKQSPLLFLCLPQIQPSCSKVKTRGTAGPLAYCNSFLPSLSVFLRTGQGMHMLTNEPQTSAMILSLKLYLSTVLGRCGSVWLYILCL